MWIQISADKVSELSNVILMSTLMTLDSFSRSVLFLGLCWAVIPRSLSLRVQNLNRVIDFALVVLRALVVTAGGALGVVIDWTPVFSL